MLRRFIFTYILFSLNVSHTIDVGPRLDITELGKEHCPATDFCTMYQTVRADSCCVDCNCNEFCAETRSCCIDAFDRWDQMTYTPLGPSCENGYYENDHYLSNTSLPFVFYYMETYCSDGRPCVISDKNSIRSFDDIVLVYSEKTKTLYRNKMCAECNGIYDYVRWRLVVVKCFHGNDSIQFMQEMGIDEALFYMLDSCSLLSVPPDLDIKRRVCTRHNVDISSCNITQEWGHFDADLQAACLNPFAVSPYITPGDQGIIYKNVFCYLCNNPVSVTRNIDQCDGGRIRDMLKDFSALLDIEIDLTTKLPTEEIVTACGKNEIMDVFYNVCRTVHCYDGKTPSYGQCINYPLRPFHSSDRIYISVSFHPISNRILLDDTTTFSGNTLLPRHIISKLNIPHCTISMDSYLSVYTDWHNYIEYIRTTLHVIKSPRCLYEHIYTAINKLWKVIIPLYVNNVSYDVSIEHPKREFRRIGTQFNITVENGTFNTFFDNDWGSSLSPMICPYVALTEAEFCELVNIYMQTRNIISAEPCPILFGVFDFREYLVCVDMLKEVHLLEANETDSALFKGILSLVTTCLSLFCIIVSIGIFLFLNKFRSTPMYIFISALCNLFTAQAVFQFGSGWSEYKRICEVMGIAVHYFWLSAVFAMNVYCVIVMRSIQTLRTSEDSRKTLLASFAYIYGLPVGFVMINMVYATSVHDHSEFRSGYGANICHIDNNLMKGLLFVLPIFLTVISNCVVYVITVYRIRSVASAVAMNRKTASFGIVYFRLLLTSGVAWLIGAANQFIKVGVLEYVFIICVAGQGIFLLISIVSSRTIRRDIKHSINNSFK